jgi:hypothetical protein
VAGNDIKRTQLRELYDALSHLKQSEQVAIAQFHATDTSMLQHRIKKDLATVAGYPKPTDPVLVDNERKALPTPVDVADLRSTIEFASALGTGLHTVVGRADLEFRYLEREPSPLRGISPERRSMDLLLVSQDGTPVFGELKRGPDNLPYYALIQLLVHLVELSNRSQRERLITLGVAPEKADALVDLYLIAYGRPHITYNDESLAATEAIAHLLMRASSVLRTQVRRIAYLHAEPYEGTLAFRPAFVAG